MGNPNKSTVRPLTLEELRSSLQGNMTPFASLAERFLSLIPETPTEVTTPSFNTRAERRHFVRSTLVPPDEF